MKDSEIKDLFGYNLKRLRKQKKISQMQLAERVGMAFTFISDIENGKKWVSPESISKFMAALDVEAYHLFLPKNYVPSENRDVVSLVNELNNAIKTVESRYLENQFCWRFEPVQN